MIEAVTGIHVSEEYKTVVTVIFLGIVIYGIEKAWEIFKNSKKDADKQPTPASIYNNYGTIITVGGNLLGVEPARLARAIHNAFPIRQVPHLARTALQFIQPARREKGTSITGGGISISAEAIEESPSALDIALDEDDGETQTPFEKREVVIHATDIDHNASGWAGHIPGIWEKRLKMKLFSSIPPARVFAKEKIVADIIVVSKRQPDGDYVPYLFHVLAVYD